MEEMSPFIRDDNGQTVMVPYSEAIMMDVTGCITLGDGCRARRAPKVVERKHRDVKESRNGRPIVSENLGFTAHQLEERVADRNRHGFKGVEFVRDKDVPTSFNVHFSSRAAYDDYLSHRQLVNRGRTSGRTLTPEALQQAEELVGRVHAGAKDSAITRR